MSLTKQAEFASRMYDPCASTYNTTHHSAFAPQAISFLSLTPGSTVLDLACGTGLTTFAAARAIGESGEVIGIDTNDGMLAEADKYLDTHKKELGGHVSFVQGDIEELDGVEELLDEEGEPRLFDAISCVSALVLLKKPASAMVSWVRFLKPGGKIVVDVPYPRNHLWGKVLESVLARLDMETPWFRAWVDKEERLVDLLEAMGLVLEVQNDGKKTRLVEQEAWGTRVNSVQKADEIWEECISKVPAQSLLEAEKEVVEKAKRMFLEEWGMLADHHGGVEEVDRVWVAVAKKPKSGWRTPLPGIKGSCACEKIKWTAWVSKPAAASHCCCVQCRKVSGAPFITFMSFPTWALAWNPTPNFVKLTPNARRGFCADCGTSLSFEHFAGLESIDIAMGSIDEDSVVGGSESLKPLLECWSYTRSLVKWWDIPEDGLRRGETMGSEAEMLKYKE